MKTAPIRPARLEFDDRGLPFAPDYGDIYHPHAGALIQAQHVFLRGNTLPQRWAGRERFVVLETGFGLGNNFLATWQAWRQDAQRCAQLHFISVEQHPLTRADLTRVHAASPLADLAGELIAAWPPLTPNLHRLSLEKGKVQLLLALGDVAAWLPELVARVDAFFLDGFAPAKNPAMWHPRLFKAMGRMAEPGATLATWTAARSVRQGLTSAGFAVRREAGIAGKRDITLAQFSPVFTPRRAVSRGPRDPVGERRALIVGAGLAGCAAAWALAEQGWQCALFEARGAVAQAASGNPGGLFHGIVNSQDGAHARFNRAAAIEAQRAVRYALECHAVQGSVAGLLRLQTALADVATMQAQLANLGLPADYVQAVTASQASALCGIALRHAAWFYPGGGWVDPTGLARAFLERSGESTRFAGGVHVHRLRRAGAFWQLLDAQDGVIDASETVVLTNAGDALRLLGVPGWPVHKVRGQVSTLPACVAPQLRIPVAGAGYVLPASNGRVLFGATTQPDDDDDAVRADDHAQNLAQLALLTGTVLEVDPAAFQGRTGWRWTSSDRLPIIGAVPDVRPACGSSRVAAPLRMDHPRHVPRAPGLFVFIALGSRGITWSALGAQVLASCITGAPVPLEASLLDTVDPARFIARSARRIAARS